MQLGRTFVSAFAIGFMLTIQPTLSTAEDEDMAVPAFTDLPIMRVPQTGSPDRLSTRPYAEEFRLLDINQDFRLNEFDVKHFQAIVEDFNAAGLTGLQLSTRFRNAQRNQGGSFSRLYDLDRDGLFSTQDVDTLSGLVNELDQGASRGHELVYLYQMRVFPPERSRHE